MILDKEYHKNKMREYRKRQRERGFVSRSFMVPEIIADEFRQKASDIYFKLALQKLNNIKM